MSSFIKYWPIIYTYNKRMQKLSNLVYYIWTDLLLPLVIIWIIFFKNISNLNEIFYYIFIYLIIYLTFMCFYEIWYIYNDIYSTKKEKHPTKKIEENYGNSYRHLQIISRIILWLFLIYILNNVLNFNYYLLFLDIMIMEIVFLIHNLIRNYSINMYTWLFLRFTKIALFVIFLKEIRELTQNNYNIIMCFLLFHFLDLFASWFYSYNKKLWWNNKMEYWYSYFFMLFVFVFLCILSKDLVFLLPLTILIPKIIFFLKTYKNAFSLKNNR